MEGALFCNIDVVGSNHVTNKKNKRTKRQNKRNKEALAACLDYGQLDNRYASCSLMFVV